MIWTIGDKEIQGTSSPGFQFILHIVWNVFFILISKYSYVSHFLSVCGSSDTWFRHPLQALYHVDSSSAFWVILHLSSSFSMFAFWKHWLESSKLGQIHASKQPASGAPGDTPSPKDVVFSTFQYVSHIWKFTFHILSIHPKSEVETCRTHCRGGPMKTWTSEEDAGPVLSKEARILELEKRFEIGKMAKPWKIEGQSIQSNLRTS